ncbi:MAG: YggS family pyridoxal phosphate-dependent enzyme [Candidatus Heimdallarchaeota archaeon]|nr:YggS family pyridoxal phosphate-dependent enzyme [Candidatus Heimdallarchaeota archaeon]
MHQIVENYNRILNELQMFSQKNFVPKICVVTKKQPIEIVRNFLRYVKNPILGENRVDEAVEKIESCGQNNATWHFIGHLQRNKVKNIIDKIKLIESLDRIELAEELEKRACQKNLMINCLVQIDVTQDGTKYGVPPDEKALLDFLIALENYEHIQIKGLMTIAPFVAPENTRSYFKRASQLYLKMKQCETLPSNVEMQILSMGMSNDYQIALEEGSTLIRLGTAIFGQYM